MKDVFQRKNTMLKSGWLLVMLLVFTGGGLYAQDTLQHIVTGRVNAPQQLQKPYVILISADGFRHDYLEKYQPPHLLSIAAHAVRAASLIPSYPSLTFPNHYSLVTGLYPSHHGLTGNTFYDRARSAMYTMNTRDAVTDGTWYGGTPLWVLAEQQQMISASMFWVGSEAAIKGIRPTYYFNYSDKIPAARRVETVRQWLDLPAEKRPHLITFYINEPDHTSHTFGPDAPETRDIVQQVDSIIQALTQTVAQTGLPVNFVFLADHGMTKVVSEKPIVTPAVIDRSKFQLAHAGTMLMLYAKNNDDIAPLYDSLRRVSQHYSVYLKKDVPPRYHYSAADDRYNRIGDIVMVAEWPYVFSDRKPGVGYHGFPATDVKDMHATFMAWGPAFRENLQIPSFENIHVYPLIAEILGLSCPEDIDGRKEVLQNILR